MTSVNDKNLQDTLLHLDYYVKKGEMEDTIAQLDEVIYASLSPDLYFKDVTDNTFSYLSESGDIVFPDGFLEKQLKPVKNPLRAIRRADRERKKFNKKNAIN